VQALKAAGADVTALALNYTTPSTADRALTGDTTSPTDVERALDGVDSVVHLAALLSLTNTSPLELYSRNVASTFNVLSQAGERGVQRAIIASSINAIGIPGNPHQVLPAYFPLDADSPFDLADAYSLSKRSDELTAGMANRAWGLSVLAYRFPRVATEDQQVLEYARTASAENAPLSRAVREGWSYIFAEDAARAIVLGLSAPVAGAHPLFIVAPETYSSTPTEELLDRYAPDVPRLRHFDGNEVPIDFRSAQSLIGFTASRLLRQEAKL
jgi:nucleoside-diphosphate-sugar epimerase